MTVHLMGAGPGDPELLTVKAARLLATADVVVHDRLAHPDVLALAPATAELIDVGKQPGRTTPQELINALLVHLGSQGLEVVRLKGGDPFVFGRGGEEAEALISAGVPFDVVPGITSAIAAPAAAGIPVTHRNMSAAFTVVTGHRVSGGSSGIEWEALAQVGGTIVILMGVSERAIIAARLMAGGLTADTPVAAVRWGTCTNQETVRTTLAGLAAAEVQAPSTIVVGAVAGFDLVSPPAMSVPEGLTGSNSHAVGNVHNPIDVRTASNVRTPIDVRTASSHHTAINSHAASDVRTPGAGR